MNFDYNKVIPIKGMLHLENFIEKKLKRKAQLLFMQKKKK